MLGSVFYSVPKGMEEQAGHEASDNIMIAQLVEHRTYNPQVIGSNPIHGTT